MGVNPVVQIYYFCTTELQICTTFLQYHKITYLVYR